MIARFRPRKPARIVDAVWRHSCSLERACEPRPHRQQKHQRRTASTAAQTSSPQPELRSLNDPPQPEPQPPRNAVGVQLLSPSLRAQLFPPTSPPFPPPPPHAVKRSLQHLTQHGLDTSAASTLPPISFPLPKLQGRTLDEHFHRLGRASAEPSLSLAKSFAQASLPPVPDNWALQSGWTRYAPDGSCEPVPFPAPEERALVFDVESMPHYSNFAIMACAASERAWYCWLSPWIMGETDDAAQLIPLGPASSSTSVGGQGAEQAQEAGRGKQDDPTRIVVGHNVSYDRARVQEEYSLLPTSNKWVDTMSLHVATHGISSHQRPAWNKYKAGRKQARARATESLEAVRGLVEAYERELGELEERAAVLSSGVAEGAEGAEGAEKERKELEKRRAELERTIADLQAGVMGFTSPEGLSTLDEELDSLTSPDDADGTTAGSNGSAASKRWEIMTSGNSLVDVAKLHCGINIEKDARDELLTFSRESVMADLEKYINYCASDVSTTHSVFRVVLPSFLQTCPSPVTWAGIMCMGSAFLPVDQEWEKYIERAEGKYRELESGVKRNLETLAERARQGGWEKAREDEWLAQLDWTEKKPKRPRGGGGGKPLRAAAVPTGKAGNGKGKGAALDASSSSSSATAAGVEGEVVEGVPAWYWEFTERAPLHEHNVRRFLPLILRLGVDGRPLVRSDTLGWLCSAPYTDPPIPVPGSGSGSLSPAGEGEEEGVGSESTLFKLGKATAHKVVAKRFRNLESPYKNLWMRLADGEKGPEVEKEVMALAEKLKDEGMRLGFGDESAAKKGKGKQRDADAWEKQLDWTLVTPRPENTAKPGETWPKWYWDLHAAASSGEMPRLDVTARSRAAPLLLRLRWQGFPLFYSRQHGWMYRVPPESAKSHQTRQTAQAFSHEDDAHLVQDVDKGYVFYKLPHKAGEEMNVGNPLAKTFVKYASDGILTADTEQSEEAQRCAADALDMNAQCSYWISARDRVMNQLVIWQNSQAGRDLGFAPEGKEDVKRGIILPHVVTMGTVTRRAIENTWLTASNAKKNRVGSELKAMVRAPDGYSIVGADVDSEELWISSVMGDAQFGMHGATAIGWMTLEGTKANGTDLHSKTASILGISRDEAKVFNYSRIYGAGLKHAELLMLQSNPKLLLEDARALVKELYARTKGQTTRTDRFFNRKFWFGGTESFLFNKLEEIALSDKPLTPALGCGVTRALTKEYLGASEYLPSRINWVVQSSGVDYLHLLIVGMQYLIEKYNISARYLISVHDELRYLVKDEDRYRAALALQIANLWTRSLFAFKLGMDDLPQGVAFFSAVDVDKYLRKETDMTCVTPSQTEPLPPGQSLDIEKVLTATNGGSLVPEGRTTDDGALIGDLEGYVEPDCMVHRSRSPAWLRAQATNELSEIRMLWKAEEEKAGATSPATSEGNNLKTKTSKLGLKDKPKAKRNTYKRGSTSPVIHVAAAPISLELWAEQQANSVLERSSPSRY